MLGTFITGLCVGVAITLIMVVMLLKIMDE